MVALVAGKDHLHGRAQTAQARDVVARLTSAAAQLTSPVGTQHSISRSTTWCIQWLPEAPLTAKEVSGMLNKGRIHTCLFDWRGNFGACRGPSCLSSSLHRLEVVQRCHGGLTGDLEQNLAKLGLQHTTAQHMTTHCGQQQCTWPCNRHSILMRAQPNIHLYRGAHCCSIHTYV